MAFAEIPWQRRRTGETARRGHWWTRPVLVFMTETDGKTGGSS